MTLAKEVVTASILNNRVRLHRARAERFGLQASRSRNPDSRAMYMQLAARETAIAERLEQQTPKRANSLSLHRQPQRNPEAPDASDFV